MFPEEVEKFIEGKKVKEISYDYSRSGDQIFEVGLEYFLKVSEDVSLLRHEALMNVYLSNYVNVSKTILFSENKGKAYYLKTRVLGKNPMETFGNKKELVKRIADAIKLFHSVPVDNCPYVIDEGYQTVIHGDFCLPNILFTKDDVSFIDVGLSGIGDPWRDYAWALWSIRLNFETLEYDDYFMSLLGISFNQEKYDLYTKD